MAEPFWAAAGPSRPTPSSFVSAPTTPLGKKKRGRFSNENQPSSESATSSIPSMVNPSSPELVPRHSSSASSWGIEDLSDSDGDYEWPTASTSASALTNLPIPSQMQSPDLDRDELATFQRPAKRVHLETPDDRHTYGKMAGLHIDNASLAASAPNQYPFERPLASRTNSGVAGAFGLSSSLASALAATSGVSSLAPAAPPSSPTKIDAVSMSLPFDSSASTFYQQAVAPVPPTSPSIELSGIAPPSSPQHTNSFDSSHVPSERPNTVDLEDADMRVRRGVPSSYEVERDRIVVTSLDDTSSSEGDDFTEGDRTRSPEADTSTESKDGSSDFVINNELIEKLEAHSRAVLTGTSDRDNAASSSRSGSGSSSNRSRRSGRRSGGGATLPSSLGSLLSSRRRSAQSSPASSGYASPINAEDARGALILWKDPDEVLRATSASSSSPLKPSDLESVPEGSTAEAKPGFMSQAPVSFQSGSSQPALHHSNPFTSSQIPGMAALPSPAHSPESPLYAQQSSLSSSYFPEPSALEARFSANAGHPAAMAPRSGFGSTSARPPQSSLAYAHEQQQQQQHQHQEQYAPACYQSSHPHMKGFHHYDHSHGAQPIDLSGHFGPAEEMDLDG